MLDLHRNWLPVPLAFPWGVFPDAEAWAAEVVDSLLAGTGVPAEGQEQLRATALTLQEDTAFTVAVQAVVVAEIGETTIAALRHLGVRDGYVFLLDFLTEDPMVLEAVQEELSATFRSIRFKDG